MYGSQEELELMKYMVVLYVQTTYYTPMEGTQLQHYSLIYQRNFTHSKTDIILPKIPYLVQEYVYIGSALNYLKIHVGTNGKHSFSRELQVVKQTVPLVQKGALILQNRVITTY